MLWGVRPAHLDEKPDGQGCRLHSAEGIPEREEAGRSDYQPGSLNNWPLQAISHLTLHMEVLLVAIHGHRHRTVLQFLYFMPSHEGLQSETQRVTALTTNTQSTMAVDRDGLHGTITHVQKLQLPASHNRQTHVTGTLSTYDHMHYRQRGHVALPHRSSETSWSPQLHRIRPGYEVHFQLLEGTTSAHGDQAPHVHSIPSTDRWCN